MPSSHGNHKMIELVEMKNELMTFENLEASGPMKAEKVGAFDDPKVWADIPGEIPYEWRNGYGQFAALSYDDYAYLAGIFYTKHFIIKL